MGIPDGGGVLPGFRQHTKNDHIFVGEIKGTPTEAFIARVLELHGRRLSEVSGRHQQTSMVCHSHSPAVLKCQKPVHASVPRYEKVVVTRVQSGACVAMCQNDTRG